MLLIILILMPSSSDPAATSAHDGVVDVTSLATAVIVPVAPGGGDVGEGAGGDVGLDPGGAVAPPPPEPVSSGTHPHWIWKLAAPHHRV